MLHLLFLSSSKPTKISISAPLWDVDLVVRIGTAGLGLLFARKASGYCLSWGTLAWIIIIIIIIMNATFCVQTCLQV